ncbi:MAG: hypothetical protein J6X55_05445 [Victivallales bacterium]|nr:hypothetical protein [Victivallales bacterium]
MEYAVPKPILAVSLNSAWQKTLSFKSLEVGGVNRAVECHEAGGGKGVNVARVLCRRKQPVALAAFIGGYTGDCLRNELRTTGVRELLVECRGVTRCCYTVIDSEHGNATELIEPSAEISSDETMSMMKLLEETMGEFSSAALCGSLPQGVPKDIYAKIVSMAQKNNVPVVLDAIVGIEAVLSVGVTLLKINHAELCQLAEGNDMATRADALLSRYPRLKWLAVTDGSEPAGFFSRNAAWSLKLPRLERIVSPIGGGDCATAIMTEFIAAGALADEAAANAFAHACACASASCLTNTPSVFDPAVADKLLPVVKREK